MNSIKPKICPICKITNNLEKIEAFSRWKLYQCKNCDAQFWWPLQGPGKRFYEKAYDMTGSHRQRVLCWGSKEFIKDPIAKSGQLLDIGCCSGDFLKVAEKIGFNVWGIDISERSIAIAKTLYGFKKVYGETLEYFIKRAGIPKFDIITFFEVLEHLDNPVLFISQARSILKRGGYLIFSTPDRDCLGGWRDTPPQHLFKWNEKNLKYLLNQQSFKIVKVIREPISYKYFFYKFFRNASPMSFGIVSKIKKKIRNKSGVKGGDALARSDRFILNSNSNSLKLAEIGAGIKDMFFKIIVSPAVLIGRLFSLKWQSIYIIAKYDN